MSRLRTGRDDATAVRNGGGVDPGFSAGRTASQSCAGAVFGADALADLGVRCGRVLAEKLRGTMRLGMVNRAVTKTNDGRRVRGKPLLVDGGRQAGATPSRGVVQEPSRTASLP